MHRSVFLEEAIRALEVKEGKRYIDATLGGGGHTSKILKLGGKVLAIEWDDERFKSSKFRGFKNFRLVLGNFKEIEKIAKTNNFYPVDGVLFDLGLSMEQLDSSGRGFSFKKENEPLDMRISRKLKWTAADFVNSLSAKKLYEVFARYSEEINSWPIAQAIVNARRLKEIKTVGDLRRVIDSLELKGKKESILRRIFQALRIKVNDELENLKQGLEGAVKILNKNGRIVVISFHSLEDRIIKQFIQKNNLKILNKKVAIKRQREKFERTAQMRVFSL